MEDRGQYVFLQNTAVYFYKSVAYTMENWEIAQKYLVLHSHYCIIPVCPRCSQILTYVINISVINNNSIFVVDIFPRQPIHLTFDINKYVAEPEQIRHTLVPESANVHGHHAHPWQNKRIQNKRI